MPLFFFHLRTSEAVYPDNVGLELPDLDTAYLRACEAIPDMTAECMSRGWNPLDRSFEIKNETGEVLIEVPFVERLRNGKRPARPGQIRRTRQLSRDITGIIDAARATIRQSRALVERSRGTV